MLADDFFLLGFHRLGRILCESVFDYQVLTVIVLPFSVLPRLFISKLIHRGRMILGTIFIFLGDVASGKCLRIPRLSHFFRSSVHPLVFGSIILGDSRNGG